MSADDYLPASLADPDIFNPASQGRQLSEDEITINREGLVHVLARMQDAIRQLQARTTDVEEVSASGGLSQEDTDALYLTKANDLSDLNDAATARTNLGLGTAATTDATDYLAVANNLSDIANVATARANLNLGSLATQNTVNDGDWSGADLSISNGGTGSSTASAARSALGLEIGSDVQAWDADLDAISGLAKTDGNFIVGNGSTWVAENAATARTSLGLGSLATLNTVNNVNWSGTDLSIANGGTGASSASAARLNIAPYAGGSGYWILGSPSPNTDQRPTSFASTSAVLGNVTPTTGYLLAFNTVGYYYVYAQATGETNVSSGTAENIVTGTECEIEFNGSVDESLIPAGGRTQQDVYIDGTAASFKHAPSTGGIVRLISGQMDIRIRGNVLYTSPSSRSATHTLTGFISIHYLGP